MRRAAEKARQNIERRAISHHQFHRKIVRILVQPILLLRNPHAHEEEVRMRVSDSLFDLRDNNGIEFPAEGGAVALDLQSVDRGC